jgi:hypothetical protein
MILRTSAFALTLALGISSCTPDDVARNIAGSDRDSVAAAGLADLRAVGLAAGQSALGVASPGDTAGIELGSELPPASPGYEPPLPIFTLSNTELAGYTPGVSFDAIIGDTVQYLYPVVKGGVVEAGILIDIDSAGSYSLAAVGGRYFTRGLMQLRRTLEAHGIPRSQASLVRMPSINRMFLMGPSASGSPYVLRLAEADTTAAGDTSVVSALVAYSALANRPGTLPK